MRCHGTGSTCPAGSEEFTSPRDRRSGDPVHASMKPYPSVGLGSIVPVRVRDTQLIEHGDVEDAVRFGCCTCEEFIGLHRRETANSVIQSRPSELAPDTWDYPK